MRGSSPGRALIVDDETQIRRMLRLYLSAKQWICFEAADPESALFILMQQPVTHALVDLHLGIHSGYDLLRTLAQRWPDVHLVAMTGSVVAARNAALAAGADAFLGKPFVELRLVDEAIEEATRAERRKAGLAG